MRSFQWWSVFPDIFDTPSGIVDEEDLEEDWLALERQFWWSKGVPWVQKLAYGGLGILRHPAFKVNEFPE